MAVHGVLEEELLDFDLGVDVVFGEGLDLNRAAAGFQLGAEELSLPVGVQQTGRRELADVACVQVVVGLRVHLVGEEVALRVY